MGRVTRDSMRVRLQEAMARLRKKYREALKDGEMQEAFDELWPAWAEEQGAMIYAEILSALDLLLLTATVDNRKEIEGIRKKNRESRQIIEKILEVIDYEN
jgi:hypothetical protein